MAKLKMMIGFGAGYVLGARAGRERYEQLMRKGQDLVRDPRVKKKASQVQDVVGDKAAQATDAMKSKISGIGDDDAEVVATQGAGPTH